MRRRIELDLNDRDRAFALQHEGRRFARIAAGIDEPEGLVGQIRQRLPHS